MEPLGESQQPRGKHRSAQPAQKPKRSFRERLRAVLRAVLRYRPHTWRDIVLGIFLTVVGASAVRGDLGLRDTLGLVALGLFGLAYTVVSFREYVRNSRR